MTTTPPERRHNNFEQTFNWESNSADVLCPQLREAILGHLPGYVSYEGRRAKRSDINAMQGELQSALIEADGFNLIGYSVVFNTDIEVSDWYGDYTERIANGALAKTLTERGDRVVVQFDHGRHPMVGSIPIAAIRAQWEDEHGLFAWDRLHRSWLVEPVAEAIRSGAIKGQSFRFQIIAENATFDVKGRLTDTTITEVRLIERGPVVFPYYEATDVALRSLVRSAPAELRAALAGDQGDVDPLADSDEPCDNRGLAGAPSGVAEDEPTPAVTLQTRRRTSARLKVTSLESR
jgi:HK97 family phage prohead protease